MIFRPNKLVADIIIILVWSSILRLIIHFNDKSKGFRKFLKEYKKKNDIKRFQSFFDFYLLNKSIHIDTSTKIVILGFNLGLCIATSYLGLSMLNLLRPISILPLYHEITIWFHYCCLALIFIIHIKSRFMKKR